VLGYPTQASDLTSRLERLLRSPHELVLVATLVGRVVGWIHGSEQELLETGPRCEILGLVVDPAARRAGIGHRLVRLVELWARDRGLPEVSVRSAIGRTESHPFYAQNGYIRVKTQHVYRKALDGPRRS
jgi:GNAT superfamily N-acetyltransferase